MDPMYSSLNSTIWNSSLVMKLNASTLPYAVPYAMQVEFIVIDVAGSPNLKGKLCIMLINYII